MIILYLIPISDYLMLFAKAMSPSINAIIKWIKISSIGKDPLMYNTS